MESLSGTRPETAPTADAKQEPEQRRRKGCEGQDNITPRLARSVVSMRQRGFGRAHGLDALSTRRRLSGDSVRDRSHSARGAPVGGHRNVRCRRTRSVLRSPAPNGHASIRPHRRRIGGIPHVGDICLLSRGRATRARRSTCRSRSDGKAARVRGSFDGCVDRRTVFQLGSVSPNRRRDWSRARCGLILGRRDGRHRRRGGRGSGLRRRNGRDRGGRLGGPRRRCGSSPRREQGQRIDVRVVVADPDTQVDIRVFVLRRAGRPCFGQGRFLFDARTAANDERAEVRQRDLVTVGALNRDGEPMCRNLPGEDDLAGNRSANHSTAVEGDVDASVLSARIGVVSERELSENRAVRGPGPGLRGRSDGEHPGDGREHDRDGSCCP